MVIAIFHEIEGDLGVSNGLVVECIDFRGGMFEIGVVLGNRGVLNVQLSLY